MDSHPHTPAAKDIPCTYHHQMGSMLPNIGITTMKRIISSSNGNSISFTINMFLSLGKIFVQKYWMCVQKLWMYIQKCWTAVQYFWTEIFLFIINFSKIGLINTFLTRKQDYCLVKFTRKQDYCLVKFTRKQDYLGCKDTKNIVSRKIMSHYFAQNGVKTLFRAE